MLRLFDTEWSCHLEILGGYPRIRLRREGASEATFVVRVQRRYHARWKAYRGLRLTEAIDLALTLRKAGRDDGG